jgi:chitin synthase
MTELYVLSKIKFDCDEFQYDTEELLHRKCNMEVLEMLGEPKKGLIDIIDYEASRNGKIDVMTNKIYENHGNLSLAFTSANSKRLNFAFGINHYCGMVEYDTTLFIKNDRDILQSYFVTLIRGNPETPGTTNDFLRALFSDKLIASQKSDRDMKTIFSATTVRRNPSISRSSSIRRANTLKSMNGEDQDFSSTIGSKYRSDINGLIDTMAATESWFIFHLKSTNGLTSSTGVKQADKKND